MAAARRGHQHRIQGVGAGGFACTYDRFQAVDQLACQLLGVGRFALVVGYGSAAALGRWNHHFDAVGGQHPHRRSVHRRIKHPLHAAEHQAHPVAAHSQGGGHYREAVVEGLLWQHGQESLHRCKGAAAQLEQATAAHQGLQGRAGIAAQGLQQSPQPLGVGQQG